MLLQVGLNLAGGSSLLPYTNTTKQILVAAFRKSVNDSGQVQLLSVQVSIAALTVYLCCIKKRKGRKEKKRKE